MIGDRSHDIAGAGTNGVAAIGVALGLWRRAELAQAGAAGIAGRPSELPGLVDQLLLAARQSA